MPHNIVNHLQVIADTLVEDGVPPHIPRDLLAKLRTAIGGEMDKIPEQASGHLYELLKWREMIHDRQVKKETLTPLDALNKADVLAKRSVTGVYTRGGIPVPQDKGVVATQAKWTTGISPRGAYGNINNAINQLSGRQDEQPPAGAKLVADVVITKVPVANQLSHDDIIDRIRAVSHTAGIETRALHTEITVPGDPRTDLSTKTTYWSEDGLTVKRRTVVTIRPEINGVPVLGRALRDAACEIGVDVLKNQLRALANSYVAARSVSSKHGEEQKS